MAAEEDEAGSGVAHAVADSEAALLEAEAGHRGDTLLPPATEATLGTVPAEAEAAVVVMAEEEE